MTASLYTLIRHVQRVNHHLALLLEDGDLPSFRRWLKAALGIAFMPDGSIEDAAGRLLFHPEQPPNSAAKLPISDDALRRKTLSEATLAAQGIRVPGHLPAVVCQEQVEVRGAEEVAERALALVLVALRAETVSDGKPISAPELRERQPLGFAALSPLELEYVEDPSPPRHATVQMSWRYEALLVMLWALELAELPPPTHMCDVARVVKLVLSTEEGELIAKARLRPRGELLDALDLHYRAHWAVRQAELDGQASPGGLDPSVVLERHYALNWLTCFEDAPWDEVDTST
jgi:hypothetical protein